LNIISVFFLYWNFSRFPWAHLVWTIGLFLKTQSLQHEFMFFHPRLAQLPHTPKERHLKRDECGESSTSVLPHEHRMWLSQFSLHFWHVKQKANFTGIRAHCSSCAIWQLNLNLPFSSVKSVSWQILKTPFIFSGLEWCNLY
jgi:hypothetical protein